MYAPLNEMILRGADPTGFGWYGAKRGTRKHKGLDVLADPGESIFSPITGFITKIGTVYKHTTEFKYIEVSNDIYRIRLMYGINKLVYINQRISGLEIIGEVQDVAGHWGNGMKNHIHIEVYKNGLLTDPEPLFFPVV